MSKHVMWMACAAVIATSSCDKSELTESVTPQTIRFDGHANKVSKALNAPVQGDNFAVFGHYKNVSDQSTGAVFTNDKVEFTTAWQYTTANGVTVSPNGVAWVPAYHYIFAAYSPYKTNSSPTVVFEEDNTVKYNLGEITLDQANQADYMTSDPEVVTAGSAKGVVRFTFSHIASRLNFKFKLTDDWVSGVTIKIGKVEVVGVSPTNTYNNNTWGTEKEGFTDFLFATDATGTAKLTDSLTVAKGGVTTVELPTSIYVVPQVVQAKVIVYGDIYHDVVGAGESITRQKKSFSATAFLNADPTIVNWSKNTAYTYTFNLPHLLWEDAQYITFGVTTVNGWGATGDASMDMHK